MKKTALMLAATLVMTSFAHAQQQQAGERVGATTTGSPEGTLAAGGTGVGAITTEMAIAGLLIVGGVVAAVAGGGGGDNNAPSTTPSTNTTTTTTTTGR